MTKRRKTRKVKIGNVEIGGNAPIAIESMTKTDTRAIDDTLDEIRKLKRAGCEIVRVAVKDRGSIISLKKIIKDSELPIVADIHFLPQLALDSIKSGVQAIRLNPGNITRKSDIEAIIKSAKERKISIRIGVNSGSLRIRCGTIAHSMVKSALDYIKIFEKASFYDIIISLKSSDVIETVNAYRKMSALCDYPFHVGITAAGPFLTSTVKSSIGIGVLLEETVTRKLVPSMTEDRTSITNVGKLDVSIVTGRGNDQLPSAP